MLKKVLYILLSMALGGISVVLPYMNKMQIWEIINGLLVLLYVGLPVISLYLFLISLIIIIISIVRVVRKKAKKVSFILFPLFILSAINFLGQVFMPDELIISSRNREIQNCSGLIKSIEEYKKDNGQYPESIHMVVPEYTGKLAKPLTYGVSEYKYVKTDKSYNLYFTRERFLPAEIEIIAYDPLENYNGVTITYGKFKTNFDHWIYSLDR